VIAIEKEESIARRPLPYCTLEGSGIRFGTLEFCAKAMSVSRKNTSAILIRMGFRRESPIADQDTRFETILAQKYADWLWVFNAGSQYPTIHEQ
jgi:hypothetical protein